MNKSIALVGVVCLVLFSLLVGLTAFAQEAPPLSFFGGEIPEGPTSGAGLIGFIQDVTDWIFVIMLVGSIVMVIFAGWQFITGGGDPQSVAQARNKLMWAAVGIIVAAMARAIPLAVYGILTG